MKAITLAIAATLSLASVAVAQTSTCSKFASAIQRSGHRVHVRSGVTAIDFNPAGEVIRHVELSNPEKVSLNFDAELDSGYTSTIFLRPISGVNIPHLPSGPTTEMLVLTQNRQGGRQTYPFTLVYQASDSNCAVLSVHPDTSGLPLVELADRRRVPVSFVTMGLELAAGDGSMPYENPLRQRVQNFVGLVRNGERVLPATQQAGVSITVVQELAQKGYDGYQSGQLGGLPR